MSENEPSPPNGTPLVRASGLTRAFRMGKRQIQVLKGLDFEIQKGESVSLIGSSGAGKSTLLHLIGGLDQPDQGSVFVDGVDLAGLGSKGLAAFRRLRVGFVFQSFNLFPELNALENVCLPARLAKRNKLEMMKKATQLLDQVGLASRMDHRPYELSGGEQQRVSIARALINSPDLVLADEPTGNLDSQNGTEIMNILNLMKEELQTTLVIATHDVKIAAKSTRVIELADGLIVSDSKE